MNINFRAVAGFAVQRVLGLGFALLAICSVTVAAQSEENSLLNTSHVTSWGYFRDPTKAQWYIANDAGICYALGANGRGHSSWVQLGNGQSICNLASGTHQVSVSPSASSLTPSDSYTTISLSDGEAETIHGGAAKQWVARINGTTVPLDWFFFRVESTRIWYIVWLGGGGPTVLKLNLTADLTNYDWKKPLNEQNVEVDTSNWSANFFQEGGLWRVHFASSGSSAPATEFLSFPISTSLYPKGPYTENRITSVLDHHMASVYTDRDGVILSFTGELFQSVTQPPPEKSGACYPKAGGGRWSALLAGLYKGTPSDGCTSDVAINYESHPGYDYFAVSGTPIFAAASGSVVSANGGCVPKGLRAGCAAWGAIGVDHGNGYISQYLHLDRVIVSPGDAVTAGQQIGFSGAKGLPPDQAHLHFEVLRRRSGFDNNYDASSYATVDPYGFDASKGYSDYITSFNGNTPNVCLWKGGCIYK